MKYIFPALFEPSEEGGFDVIFPDIQRCYTCGSSLAEALEMAEDVLAMTLCGLEMDGEPIPFPSLPDAIACNSPSFVTLIKADTAEYHKKHNRRAVKKTLTIPAWLNQAAEASHINFSSVLQEALKERLNLVD